MALRFVPPAPQVLSSYQESLTDFLGPHDPEAELFHLPVEMLGLTELARDGTLRDVVNSGCRFVAAWLSGRVTSCEVTDPTLYTKGVFRNFVEGDAAVQVFEAINRARSLDSVQTMDFELRYLTISGIQFEGLRLVCLGSGSDLILSVVSASAELDTGVVEAESFLALARRAAAVRLALPVSPLSN